MSYSNFCRSKVVATVGPASSSADQIRGLIDAGVDVFRLNLSHGDHAEHKAVHQVIREATADCGRAIAIVADLQGPKIRVGPMPPTGVTLVKGEPFILTTEGPVQEGTASRAWLDAPSLSSDVKTGHSILMDDGRLRVRVVNVEGPEIQCVVEVGGLLQSRKGVNLPDTQLSSLPSLTPKDEVDLEFILKLGVEFIALSFVRSESDVLTLRQRIGTGFDDSGIISKIEKPEALQNLNRIIAASNGLMVARGDLGVELSPEKVPMAQKAVIQAARRQGRFTIVATEMLQSMVNASRPTRAEAGDVANAVLDGADAVMLSQETSIGDHPELVVETMRRICREVESTGAYAQSRAVTSPEIEGHGSIQNACARAALGLAADLRAKAICFFTATGTTARLSTDYACDVPVLAFTPSEAASRRMAIYHGVTPIHLNVPTTVDGTIDRMTQELVDRGICSLGDLVVVTAKSRPTALGGTDTLRVVRV